MSEEKDKNIEEKIDKILDESNETDESQHNEFKVPPENEIDDSSLDKVEKDFNREKQVEHIKETLWQNKKVRMSLIAMGGLAMMSYIAWVLST